MEPSGLAFGKPKDRLRGMRVGSPGLRFASSGLQGLAVLRPLPALPRRRGRETALSARGRAASLSQHFAPQALPVLA